MKMQRRHPMTSLLLCPQIDKQTSPPYQLLKIPILKKVLSPEFIVQSLFIYLHNQQTFLDYMRKLVFTLLIILSFCKFGFSQDVIEAELQNVLNQKGDEMIRINIILKSQMNLNDMRNRAANVNDKYVRRNILIDELKQFSEKEQQEILSFLDAGKRNESVKDINCHWLANYINCRANRDIIYKLSQHPDVYLIGYDEEKVLLSNDYSGRAVVSTDMTENITKVNADDVWEMGYTGEGIIVAVIDSGVNYKHIDIADHLWDGGAEFPNHGYNTYSNNNDPMDKFGHGTHCAGTICGDGSSGVKTGIAPNVTLMCVKSVSDEGTGTANHINSGMEWAIDHNADVLSMSLGVTMPTISEKEMLRRSCVTALELGIVAAVAAGNYGANEYQMLKPVPENVIIPGGCPPPWLHPDQEANAGELSCVISVGATDYNDIPADFSSQGPVTWENTEFNDYPYNPGIGLIRPDICAPGVSIISLDYSSDNSHTSMNGTSMATPCVAGIISLMLEKDPNLSPADICRILETTSVKLSETKSNKTGSGRVDALAAINAIDNGDFTFINYSINDVNGNDNANINAGENVNLDIVFKNNSEQNYNNIKAVLRSDNTLVTITDSTAQINTISANENISITNEFSLTLVENVEPKTLLAFDVYFYNENNELISYFRAPVYVSGNNLQFSSFIVKNDDNGNGLLEAGETADLGIVLNNIGNEIAVALKGVLTTTNDKLIINQNEAEFGSIGNDASATAFFNVTLSESTSDNFKLPIEVKVTDAFNNEHTFEGTYKNACEVVFELYDTGGDGWNGGAAIVVKYSDGTPDEAFTVISGSTKTYKRKIGNDVKVTLEWVKGSWDLENSFVITNESGNVIYRNGGFLDNGYLFSWVNNCSCQYESFEMCEPVEDLDFNNNGTTVNLYWNAPNNPEIVNFEVYRGTKLIATTNNSLFTDESISKSGKYVYSVRAIYEDCSGLFEHVTVDISTGINEDSKIEASVYPNPSHDNFTIVCENMTRISVYNVVGTIIMDSSVNCSNYIISNLNSGVYFIYIETLEGNAIRKVVKIN